MLGAGRNNGKTEPRCGAEVLGYSTRSVGRIGDVGDAWKMKVREPLSGLVERVTFHSGETGFCVLRVKVRGQRDLVTVLGSAAEIHGGEHIQASGQWEQHREHGAQFRAQFLQVTPPSSREGIER